MRVRKNASISDGKYGRLFVMSRCILSLFALALFFVSFASAESVPPQITPDGAAAILKEVIPDAKVLETHSSPISGLTEVAVESKGQKGILYLDSTGKYLVSGSIVEIRGKRNLTQERLSEVMKVDVSEIPLADAVVMGDKNAPKRVIVFTDPD
jgi:protein-disulfide isomerase